MNIYTRREAACALMGSAVLRAQSVRTAENIEGLQTAVSHFSKRSQDHLIRLAQENRFEGFLSAADARTLAAAERQTMDQFLVGLLPLAQTYSRAPLTNYKVGAVVRGERGDLYLGANLEVPSNVLSFTVHAEQSAVANAFTKGDTGILDVAVSGAPCGHCRQFLYEMVGKQDIRIIPKGRSAIALSALLPSPFGPKDLGLSGNPFSKEPTSLRLEAQGTEQLWTQALHAAAKSYAPYSKALSGVALRSGRGRVFSGSYLENAAFNPSLSPLQVALTGMVRAGEPFANIEEVALVELRDAAISQLAASESVLKALAPKAKLSRRIAHQVA